MHFYHACSLKCFLIYYLIWLFGPLGDTKGRCYFYLLYQENWGTKQVKQDARSLIASKRLKNRSKMICGLSFILAAQSLLSSFHWNLLAMPFRVRER